MRRLESLTMSATHAQSDRTERRMKVDNVTDWR